jgi:peptidoglycan-associated lipoprotein
MKNVWVIIASAALIAMGGCSLKKGATKADAGTTAPSADAAGSGDVANAGTVGTEGTGDGPQGELLSKRIIYFDYDSAEIRVDSQQIVAAHARYLADNPAMRVRLEGHADERGSREYNIGLGERRSQAVRRSLLLQGGGEVQLTTVSYGEERPAVAGSDEEAYAQNRRVELIYVK